MKISNSDMEKIYDVVKRLHNGVTTLNDYTPIMVFQNDGDTEKVKKGLSILNKKLDEIVKCKNNKELKKVIKIKKIIMEDE